MIAIDTPLLKVGLALVLVSTSALCQTQPDSRLRIRNLEVTQFIPQTPADSAQADDAQDAAVQALVESLMRMGMTSAAERVSANHRAKMQLTQAGVQPPPPKPFVDPKNARSTPAPALARASDPSSARSLKPAPAAVVAEAPALAPAPSSAQSLKPAPTPAVVVAQAPAPAPAPVQSSAQSLKPAPAPADLPNSTDLRVLVKGFRITGPTLLPQESLLALLPDLTNKELHFSQVQSAASRISEHYRAKGYLAQAQIPRQTMEDGMVEILVTEGKLGEVQVETPTEPPRLKPEIARQMVLQQHPLGSALDPQAVHRGLRLLNEIPGTQASGALKPGQNPGETDLSITLGEASRIAQSYMGDNYGSKSAGPLRLGATLAVNNPTGLGDQFNLLALASERSAMLRGGFEMRIGYSGLRVGASVTQLTERVGGSVLYNLDAHSATRVWGLNAGYPLRRSANLDANLALAFDYKHNVNNANQGNVSDKSIRSYNLGVSAEQRDNYWNEGLNKLSANVQFGNTDLSGNAIDAANDLVTARSQGDFYKISYSAARLQKINDRISASVAWRGQRAQRNLDSGEQFALGGPNGIRAFSPGEASGDEGWLLSTEGQYQWSEQLQFQAFLDTGGILLHKDPWANWDAARPGAPNQYGLTGSGLGFVYHKKNSFTLTGTIAWRIGANPGTADNRDSDGSTSPRLWVQLSKPL